MKETKDFLKQVKMLDMLIKNKTIEAAQWRALAEGGTPAYGTEKVQTSVNPDRMTNAINRCIELEKEAEKERDHYIEVKQDIIRVIQAVNNPAEYDLLYMIYLNGYSLKEYAALRGKDYNTITTAHGRALAKVKHILKEREVHSNE